MIGDDENERSGRCISRKSDEEELYAAGNKIVTRNKFARADFFLAVARERRKGGGGEGGGREGVAGGSARIRGQPFLLLPAQADAVRPPVGLVGGVTPRRHV